MTPTGTPTPDSPRPVPPELTNAARDFRLRMAVIDRETQTALDMTRDRYGRTVHASAAAAARAQRDKAALEAYTTHLAPHADALLDAALRALDELPPARHLAGWRTVLVGLAASATEIRRALDRSAAPGSPAERAQHSALWLHLTAWADHSFIASNLADQSDGQHHKAPLPEEEQRMWTELAQAAQRRAGADRVVVRRRRAADHPRPPGRRRRLDAGRAARRPGRTGLAGDRALRPRIRGRQGPACPDPTWCAARRCLRV